MNESIKSQIERLLEKMPKSKQQIVEIKKVYPIPDYINNRPILKSYEKKDIIEYNILMKEWWFKIPSSRFLFENMSLDYIRTIEYYTMCWMNQLEYITEYNDDTACGTIFSDTLFNVLPYLEYHFKGE